MFIINNLSKSFGTHKVLKEINLKCESKGLHIITGPNGSGKSTLLYIIAGLIKSDEGQILIENQSESVVYNEFCSYQFSENLFFKNKSINFNISILSNLSNIPTERIKKELMDFEVLSLNKKMSELSTGMMQKVKIAFALCKKSQYYFLDEPIANLDTYSINIFLEKVQYLIENEEKTIILISHNIEPFLKYCPKIYYINKN